jgi:hypothetical protein
MRGTVHRLAQILVLATLSATGSLAAPAAENCVVLERCALVDTASGEVIPERTIVVRGDRIAQVARPGDAVDAPEGATRIDGRGKFAMPGLIDAHVHLAFVLDLAGVAGEEVLPLYLAAGVTSVRSTGDAVQPAARIARYAEAHPNSSPRVFLCSPLLDGDPPIHRSAGLAVARPDLVPAALDLLQRANVRTIKIYAGTGRDVGKAIIRESHRRGLPVTAHLGNYAAQDAVADGVDGLEHIWSVFNYVIPPDVAGRPGHRATLDFDTPLCRSLLADLVRRNVYVDPTLVVFRNMILLPDLPEIRNHADNALVPGKLREFWPIYLRQTGCPQGGALAQRRAEFAKYQQLTGRLHRAGVRLLAGTDSPEPHVPPGFSLHQELELLVQAGLTPAAALRAATLDNAAALGEQRRLGSIAPGKLADILLLAANPLTDIRNTRSIQCVLRGGRVVRPADLLPSRRY